MSGREITLPRSIRGRRPHFFENPETDVLMSVVMELTSELSVLHHRVDAMQRLMDAHGVLAQDALEAFEPTAEQAAERANWREEYMRRVFRVVRSEAAVFSTSQAEEVLADLEQELSEAD